MTEVQRNCRLIGTVNFVSRYQTIARWSLAGFLFVAGTSHLAWNSDAFLAQVPGWVPVNASLVVFVSGVVEIALALALVGLPGRRRQVGWVVAGFFVAVFPGNISQFLTQTDAFGLNSDLARGVRLAFQPLLVLWALWSVDELARIGRLARRR